jgi:hypothetical protein
LLIRALMKSHLTSAYGTPLICLQVAAKERNFASESNPKGTPPRSSWVFLCNTWRRSSFWNGISFLHPAETRVNFRNRLLRIALPLGSGSDRAAGSKRTGEGNSFA